MKKLGVWGYFGYRNCGDDLLLINTIDEICSILSDDVNIVVFGDSNNIKNLVPFDFVYTRNRTALNLMRFAFEADYLIIGPGGLFPSTNSKKLFFYFIITLIMHVRRKKIGFIGVGVGIGMFSQKRDILLINLITRYANVFISRSKNYLAFVPKIKSNRIILSSDMILSDKKIFLSNYITDSKKIVVALANIFNSNTEEYKERFISEFINFANNIISNGYQINMISFTNEIDMELNNIIVKRINSPYVVSTHFFENPYDTFQLIKDAYLCIGMRFHALVIALSCNIPCISVSYSDKNEDIMERFGLSDYSLRFGISNKEYYNKEIMIDSKILIEKFNNIISYYDEVKNIILSKKNSMYELSLLNRKELRNLLKRERK